MGSTAALEGGTQEGLRSGWTHCGLAALEQRSGHLQGSSLPAVPTMQCALSPSSGLEMPPVFQAGVGTMPLFLYARVDHSFIKHSTGHPHPSSLQADWHFYRDFGVI